LYIPILVDLTDQNQLLLATLVRVVLVNFYAQEVKMVFVVTQQLLAHSKLLVE
jgi:hypothetical protein